MASNGSNSATWVQARYQAVRSATAGGAGVAESFTFTPSVSDWYGLVLINRAGSGTYTLQLS